MKGTLFFLCFLSSYCVFAQYRPDKMEGFNDEVDSIIIRAAKERCHEVKVKITPYEGKRILPAKPIPGKVIPITWTKVSDQDDIEGELNIIFTFLNDSVVEQQMDGEKYFGKIKGGKISEDDKITNEIKSFWNYTERDSLGFKIVDRWVSKGKDNFISYNRLIYDSKSRLVERCDVHNGIIANCQTFSYYGDTVWIMKTYVVPHDTTFTKVFCNECDSAGKITAHVNTFHVKEWHVFQNDSLALIDETCGYKTISRDHKTVEDSLGTISYDIYSDKKPTITKDISKYTFVYDSTGHLISEEELSHTSSGFNWKNEMTVIYKKRKWKHK